MAAPWAWSPDFRLAGFTSPSSRADDNASARWGSLTERVPVQGSGATMTYKLETRPVWRPGLTLLRGGVGGRQCVHFSSSPILILISRVCGRQYVFDPELGTQSEPNGYSAESLAAPWIFLCFLTSFLSLLPSCLSLSTSFFLFHLSRCTPAGVLQKRYSALVGSPHRAHSLWYGGGGHIPRRRGSVLWGGGLCRRLPKHI